MAPPLLPHCEVLLFAACFLRRCLHVAALHPTISIYRAVPSPVTPFSPSARPHGATTTPVGPRFLGSGEVRTLCTVLVASHMCVLHGAMVSVCNYMLISQASLRSHATCTFLCVSTSRVPFRRGRRATMGSSHSARSQPRHASPKPTDICASARGQSVATAFSALSARVASPPPVRDSVDADACHAQARACLGAWV